MEDAIEYIKSIGFKNQQSRYNPTTDDVDIVHDNKNIYEVKVSDCLFIKVLFKDNSYHIIKYELHPTSEQLLNMEKFVDIDGNVLLKGVHFNRIAKSQTLECVLSGSCSSITDQEKLKQTIKELTCANN